MFHHHGIGIFLVNMREKKMRTFADIEALHASSNSKKLRINDVNAPNLMGYTW